MAQNQKMGELLKPSNSTRLQGFHINGVLLPTTKVTRDSLMKWAIGKGRSKARKLNKQELCEAIVGWKAVHDITIANGTAEIFNPVTQCPFWFNTKRFLNVISYVNSQESLIVSIVECKNFISDYESQHCDQKTLLKSSLCDLSNEK